jgi:hypothetical protein
MTPIVVRHTIQNSDFKLVGSEFSLFSNLNSSSFTKDQNYITLQNNFGSTLPIFNVFL